MTGPLATQIHLSSACFDSKAAATQMNVFLCYDSISRASVVFPSLSLSRLRTSVVLSGAETRRPPPREGPGCWGTRLDDPPVCRRGKTQEMQSE